MLEGKIAIFEVGLALLRMQQDELLQFNNDGDMIAHIRKRTQELHDPKKLITHVCIALPSLVAFIGPPLLYSSFNIVFSGKS